MRVKNLCVSESAHLVLPYHRELDAQREMLKGKNKIGTTKRGIGPAYGDKAARTGLRMIDLINPDRFEALLRFKIKENNEILKAFGAKPLSFAKVHAAYRAAGDRLKPFVTNTVVLLHEATQRGQNILFEGAQGTFLDIDHGTYPFVTSSNTTAGRRLHRLRRRAPPHGPRRGRDEGLHHPRRRRAPCPPKAPKSPTCSTPWDASSARPPDGPRRCGWFDAVATHYATIINGIDELAVTNLDGLDNVETIKVCIAYRAGPARLDYVPGRHRIAGQVRTGLCRIPRLADADHRCKKWSQLPARARTYLAGAGGIDWRRG